MSTNCKRTGLAPICPLFDFSKKFKKKTKNKKKQHVMNKSFTGLPKGHWHYNGRIQQNNTPSESNTLIMVMSQCKVTCAAEGSYNLHLQGTS